MSQLQIFFKTVKLPTIPDLAHSLIETLNNENASVEEISDLITRDPAISAKLVRIANSALFGLPREVARVEDAIAMVGINKVRAVALGASLRSAFPKVAGLDPHAFWKTSMACAGYAQWLAPKCAVDLQVAWLAGMMVRLGEILIAQAQPQALPDIEKASLPGERWMREKQIVGYTEGEITAELARRWRFPALISEGLQTSAEPLFALEFSRLGAVLHLAGLLADIPNAGPEHVELLPEEVLTALALDAQWMRKRFPSNADFIDAL